MSKSQIRLNNISQEKRVSNCLTYYPISEHSFDLNKQNFEAVFNVIWRELTNIPSLYACSDKLDMQHVMSWKKRGFTTIRHTMYQIKQAVVTICKNIDIEPKLLLIIEEAFDYQTATTSNKARVNIRARGFW